MENICFPLAVDIFWFNYLPDLSLRTWHRIYHHHRNGGQREFRMNYAQGDIISLLAAVFISHSCLPLARCKINIRYQFVSSVHVTNNANWFTVCVRTQNTVKMPSRLCCCLPTAGDSERMWKDIHCRTPNIEITCKGPKFNLCERAKSSSRAQK